MAHSFQELAVSILAFRERESKQYGRSNLIHIADECLRAISQEPSDSRTSEKFADTEENSPSPARNAGSTRLAGSMCSAEASPAKTSATLASERESTENAADSGASTQESFANYDPATSSWRTSQPCLDGEWSEFSETWPRAGMTRSGRVYELPMLVRPTEENESGLWPTPRAIYGEHPGMSDSRHLTGAVQFWPTPRASDATGGFWTNHEDGRQGGPGLKEVIRGQLNPTWVEWLMGYPPGWTALEDSGTPSSRKSRSSSAEGL